MTRRHSVAVIPGDGIGPEVTEGALLVLSAAAEAEGSELETTTCDLGAERYLRSGEVLPDDDLEQLASQEAILLGAVGDPRVPPGVLEKGLLLRVRQELDLYVNLRPARLMEGVRSALADVTPDDLDVLIVRENTEGLYRSEGTVRDEGTENERALETSLNTAAAVSRIVSYAFDAASQRGQSLTLVHKTNVLERAGGLYRRTFDRFAAQFPEVPTSYQHVDAAALLLVMNPRRFSVIVTDNLFGDILSDLVAGLVGGIGFVGSANLHPGKTSMFEPVHGSAPDIAGTGRANPVGAILSAALMLRHLGEEGAAERVEAAVATVAGSIEREELSTRRASELIAEVAGS
ncbi:MAG: 3-isopropylmalate dehydrogenase [Actinomycetota bacterium]|nr:3-isopropylmalate dehydrogenase [Actinomycetota bacterium]